MIGRMKPTATKAALRAAIAPAGAARCLAFALGACLALPGAVRAGESGELADALRPDNAFYEIVLLKALRGGQDVKLWLGCRQGAFTQAWATRAGSNSALRADASALKVVDGNLNGFVKLSADSIEYVYALHVPVKEPAVGGTYEGTYGNTEMVLLKGEAAGEIKPRAEKAGRTTVDLQLGKPLAGGNNWQCHAFATLTVEDGKVVEAQVRPHERGGAWEAQTTGVDMSFDGAALRGKLSFVLNSRCPIPGGNYTFVLDGQTTANTITGTLRTLQGEKEINQQRFYGQAAAGPAAAANPDEAVFALVLEQAVDGVEKLEIHLDRRQGAFTGGVAVVPKSWQQLHAVDVSNLKLEGSTLKGEVRVTVDPWCWPARGPRPAHFLYEIEAETAGSELKGSYQGRPLVQEIRGDLTGRQVSWEQRKRDNALAAGSDYPRWRGPHANGSAAPCGKQLVDDLAKARLLWRSAERTPDSWIWSRSSTAPISGGFSDPVVAGDMVYVAYYVPSGDVVDEAKHEAAPATPREKWLVGADDVILCIDARTGETVWKTVFADKGVNWNGGCSGPLMTPCVAAGKVFVVGSTGRVYCADARTGATLWESTLGPETDKAEQVRQDALKVRGMIRFNRDFCSCPLLIAGVLVCNDNATGLIGLDPATGARLWGPVSECISSNSSPSPWSCDGVNYVLAAFQKAVCVEPRTGKVVWEVKEDVANEGCLAVGAHHMVTGGGGKPSTGITCFRIDAQGARKLWNLPKSNSHVTSPVIYNNHVYGWEGAGSAICVEIESGQIVGKAEFWSVRSCSSFLAADGRIVRPDLYNRILLYDADPRNFRQLGGMWFPGSCAECTSGSIADGRFFFRTKDSVSCYDLRAERAEGAPVAPPKPEPSPPPEGTGKAECP